MSDWEPIGVGSARVLRTLVVAVLTCTLAPPLVAAAERVVERRPGPNDGLPISKITVVPLEIYDPVPPGRLAGVFRLANRLHIRTRQRTVRRHLLFEVDDRWTDKRGRETVRVLRSLDFLTPDTLEARRENDSVSVLVVTRDTWTTSPDLNLESSDGHSYGSIGFTERNLLGLGKSVSFSYRDDPTGGRSRSFSYDDLDVAGTHAVLHYAAGKGGDGAIDRIMGGLPFYAEDTPHSALGSYSRTSSRSHLYRAGTEVASLDQRYQEWEVLWGAGERVDEQIRRITYSFWSRDRDLGPSMLGPNAQGFEGGEEHLSLRRVAVEGRLWNPDYVERRHVNRMGITEDFDLGESATLKLGVSPRMLGSTADEGYGSVRLSAGAENPLGFGWARANLASRFRRRPRDVFAQFDLRWYYPGMPLQTVALAVQGSGTARGPRDFQLQTGGLDGLRAYPVHALAGRRMLKINLEDRWRVRENGQVFNLGAVVFADAARATGLGAESTGWFLAGGAGLRIALPRWSLSQIIRLDVAWPIKPERDGRHDAVISFGSSQAF